MKRRKAEGRAGRRVKRPGGDGEGRGPGAGNTEANTDRFREDNKQIMLGNGANGLTARPPPPPVVTAYTMPLLLPYPCYCRCPVAGCKTKLTTINRYRCKHCNQAICLKHRDPADHRCQEVQGACAGACLRLVWP
jgi:hypothetical protein